MNSVFVGTVYTAVVKIAALILLFAGFFPGHADVLVKRDGTRLEGSVTFNAGTLQVGRDKLPLAEVAEVQWAIPAAAAPKDELARLTAELMALPRTGALTRNGSFIAGAVEAVNDTKVTFANQPAHLFLSTQKTAALFFAPVSFHLAHQLRNRKPGLLLASGDYFEGELRQLHDGRVEMQSILFGRKTFAVGTEALALWLGAPKVDATHFSVQTRDGSVLRAEKIDVQPAGVLVDQPPVRRHRFPLGELAALRRGGPDALTAAWQRIDQADPADKARLLTSLANVDRILQVRRQLSVTSPQLKAAIAAAAKADTLRNALKVRGDTAKRDYDRLRQVWTRQNQAYQRAKSDERRLQGQIRGRLARVRAARNEMARWQRQVKTESTRLVDAEKQFAQAEPNRKNALRSRRDSAKRQLATAQRQLERTEKKHAAEQQSVDEFAAKQKPAATAKIATAKQAVDAAHRDKEAAQTAHRKALDAWRVANKNYFTTQATRNRLQTEHNAALEEIDKIRPTIPDPPDAPR